MHRPFSTNPRTLGAATALLVAVLAACGPPPTVSDGAALSASPTALATPSAPPPTLASIRPDASVSPASDAPASAVWSRIEGAGEVPAPREDHTWTVVGDGSTALLFGGRDGATVHGDLWSYEFASDRWTPVETEGGPAARFGHEALWVDGIGLVVFAGQAGATFFADLWAFDPATGAWEELPSSGAVPTPRYGTCLAAGPDGRLWISHGFTSDGTRFADTRAWDPETGEWTDETPDGSVPVNRCLHGCWWTDDGAFVLFGGQTTGVTSLDDRWILRDGAWDRVEGSQPSARNLYARARLEGATLVLGGQALDGSYLSDGWWLVDGTDAAMPLAASGEPPPGRSGAELVVDLAADRLLLFGGRDGNAALADVWQLDAVSAARP